MKAITPEFVQNHGFKKVDTIHEDAFYYDEFYNDSLDIGLAVFFNYYKDGNSDYSVDLDGSELINVGEYELKVLLDIIPKT